MNLERARNRITAFYEKLENKRFELEKVGKGLSTADAELSGVLGQVQHFLNLSNNGSDLGKLSQALTYLGSLPVAAPILDTTKRGPLIAIMEKELGIDPGESFVFDRKQFVEMKSAKSVFYPQVTFSGDAFQNLKSLYLDVFTEYRQSEVMYHRSPSANEAAWVYEYPPGVFDSLEFSLMGEGEESASLRDFARDIEIDGVSGSGSANAESTSQQDKEDAAGERVNKIVGESNYPEESREKVIKWMKNRGGQEPIVAVPIELIIQEHFADELIRLEGMQNIAGWSLQEGKLVLNFDIQIGCVGVGDKAFVMREHGVVEAVGNMLDETARLKSDIDEENAKRRKANKPLIMQPSVLQLNGSMTLLLDSEGNVKPKIMSLKATSFTPELLSPERKFGAVQEPPKIKM